MDVRRALLGRPDGRFRIAGTVGLVFVFAFVLYAAYWRSNAAYGASTEVTTQLGAIRAVAPEISDIGHSRATAVLYLPAAAIAILVQYHGGAAIYTLAAGPPSRSRRLSRVRRSAPCRTYWRWRSSASRFRLTSGSASRSAPSPSSSVLPSVD
ncbi:MULTISPECIES: hypothetical protein [unclassified Halorubrum]|uniref:hypothetical protein n=1 Tax=unclassified Halorubrum TaxID=2642239 RepID=UPI001E4BD6E7|nr:MULTISPECIES: hypothetical protein [unclassified Halorubrum]